MIEDPPPVRIAAAFRGDIVYLDQVFSRKY